jgi:spore coat protein CotF
MDEKNMVNDIIENYKSVLKNYNSAITDCRNMELRQLFQNQRNSYESFQYEISLYLRTPGNLPAK